MSVQTNADPAINAAVEALPPLRDVIRDHGLAARKSLGQNFLLDLNLTSKIARSAGDLTLGTVIEVGPGPGGLTRALLLEGATRLVAIEKDTRCIEALAPLVDAAKGRMTLVQADAMAMDFTALGPPPYKIVSNLPYNIATPLLIGWMRQAGELSVLSLMFQREVAERIVATLGSKPYSRLSVLCNWRCETRISMALPPQAFTPPPKVSSAVVTLIPRTPAPNRCSIEILETVTQAAFGQRRKMLRGSLKSLNVDTDALLKSADIDPTLRAEDVSVAGFENLAHHFDRMR